jgi:hypothetical protein
MRKLYLEPLSHKCQEKYRAFNLWNSFSKEITLGTRLLTKTLCTMKEEETSRIIFYEEIFGGNVMVLSSDNIIYTNLIPKLIV